jgi:hypothetical protein
LWDKVEERGIYRSIKFYDEGVDILNPLLRPVEPEEIVVNKFIIAKKITNDDEDLNCFGVL